jgi:hypothetical protein
MEFVPSQFFFHIRISYFHYSVTEIHEFDSQRARGAVVSAPAVEATHPRSNPSCRSAGCGTGFSPTYIFSGPGRTREATMIVRRARRLRSL